MPKAPTSVFVKFPTKRACSREVIDVQGLPSHFLHSTKVNTQGIVYCVIIIAVAIRFRNLKFSTIQQYNA